MSKSKKNRVRVFEICNNSQECPRCEYYHDHYTLAPHTDKWYEVSDEELGELLSYEKLFKDKYLVVLDRENENGTSKTLEDLLKEGRAIKREMEEREKKYAERAEKMRATMAKKRKEKELCQLEKLKKKYGGDD